MLLMVGLRLRYKANHSERYNNDAQHLQLLDSSHEPRRMEAGDILAGLSERQLAQALDWIPQSYKPPKASLAVVRFVSCVGSNMTCALTPRVDGTNTS